MYPDGISTPDTSLILFNFSSVVTLARRFKFIVTRKIAIKASMKAKIRHAVPGVSLVINYFKLCCESGKIFVGSILGTLFIKTC